MINNHFTSICVQINCAKTRKETETANDKVSNQWLFKKILRFYSIQWRFKKKKKVIFMEIQRRIT